MICQYHLGLLSNKWFMDHVEKLLYGIDQVYFIIKEYHHITD